MNFSWCLTQVTCYWPVVVVLIMAVIVSLVIIYTKVSSDPVLVYFFGETVKIINSSRNAFSPQIAASGDNVYVVWADKSTGYGDIYLKKITNNNTIFNSTINLSNNNGNSTNPQIAASGDNVYVVWADKSTGYGDIYLKKITNNNTIFNSTINLSNNNGNSTNPQIAASGDNVYVVWVDNSGGKDGNGDVFFSSSKDNGTSFDEPTNLSNNNGNSTNPQIAASGDNVYVVWADNTAKKRASDKFNVLFKASTDNGNYFSERQIMKKDIDKITHLPQIAASGDKVYVVLADEDTKKGVADNFRLTLKASTDNGTNFNEEKIKKVDIDKRTYLPKIAAFGDKIFLVLAYNTGTMDGNGDVFFSSSKDNGTSFDEPTNLSNNIENSTNPEISTSGNNVYVLWSDFLSTKTEINYKHIGLIALE
jgi:hypothetical protein